MEPYKVWPEKQNIRIFHPNICIKEFYFMAQAYLFVHFREKTTPDGEQVYFGISRDGFHWEAVNDGAPDRKSTRLNSSHP